MPHAGDRSSPSCQRVRSPLQPLSEVLYVGKLTGLVALNYFYHPPGVRIKYKTNFNSIIALMLGRLRMTVDQCIEKYVDLSAAAFQPKRAKINIFGKVKDTWKTDGAYRGNRLVSEFKTVSEQEEGDPDAKLLQEGGSCRV